MSFEVYLILFGVVLMLIDFFFASDFPTFVAILIFCYVFFRILPIDSLLIRIILTILFFFILLVTYITLWKKAESIIVDKWFAKDKYLAGADGFPGKKGTVKTVEGEKYACIDGDLYAFFEDYGLEDQAEFIVKEVRDSRIVVEGWDRDDGAFWE